ncbi:hypothetical protein ACGFW5_16850 [Streptomyces sp. NPDC048416]|uniref:hypothetical protein n=1 Tax=Streptomyces sp. NPDC048416 TaxID=3365546 RepID=UPI00372032DC
MGGDALDVTSHLAATDMANGIRDDRIGDAARHDNEIFGKEGYGEWRTPVVIAAEPDTGHHPLRSDGDRQVPEAGWHKPVLSTHPDAAAAIGAPHAARAYAHGLASWRSTLEDRDMDWSDVSAGSGAAPHVTTRPERSPCPPRP